MWNGIDEKGDFREKYCRREFDWWQVVRRWRSVRLRSQRDFHVVFMMNVPRGACRAGESKQNRSQEQQGTAQWGWTSRHTRSPLSKVPDAVGTDRAPLNYHRGWWFYQRRPVSRVFSGEQRHLLAPPVDDWIVLLFWSPVRMLIELNGCIGFRLMRIATCVGWWPNRRKNRRLICMPARGFRFIL